MCAARVFDAAKLQLTSEQEEALTLSGGLLQMNAGLHTVTDCAAIAHLLGQGGSESSGATHAALAASEPGARGAAVAGTAAPEVQVQSVTVFVASETATVPVPPQIGSLFALLRQLVAGSPTARGQVNMRDAAARALGSISPVLAGVIGHAVLSLLAAVMRQRRIAGLRYGAENLCSAPAPAQVVWHVAWNLHARYVKQVRAATEALALVSLTRIRYTAWWSRRAGFRKLAERRLSQCLLASDSLPDLPTAYASYLDACEKEDVDTEEARAQQEAEMRARMNMVTAGMSNASQYQLTLKSRSFAKLNRLASVLRSINADAQASSSETGGRSASAGAARPHPSIPDAAQVAASRSTIQRVLKKRSDAHAARAKTPTLPST
ncbi:MAG: hypothetical protein EOO41_03520, partial [Methanobacteriota archaeon]